MGIFWHDLREATKKQPCSPLTGIARTLIACGLAVATAALAQQAPATVPQKPRRTHHAVRPKPVVPESIPQIAMPAPPPPAPRVPEQMPPSVPQVSWDGSQLTITATNSTLADILVAIRTRTGAEIDVPPGASQERIAAQLGPGPAREVIGTLLSWTDFDYIIQASDTDPLGVQTVMLTPRGKSDAMVASVGMGSHGSAARRTVPRLSQSASAVEAPAQENSGSSEAETPAEVPVAATPSAPAEPRPVAASASASTPDATAPQAAAESKTLETLPVQANLNAAPVPPEADQSQAGASPAEQRMQMLQSLYQQRKQMIQDARKNQPAN